MMSPTTVEPKRTIAAPAPVINVAIPSQAAKPKDPALVKLMMEMKNKSAPTMTFGWAIGTLSFETRSPKLTKINGTNIVVQEKSRRRKSFNLTRINPLLEKETIMSPAKE